MTTAAMLSSSEMLTAPELPLENTSKQDPLGLYCGLLGHLTEQIRETDSLTYRIASWLLIIKILQYLEDHLDLVQPEGLQTHKALMHVCLGYGESLLIEVRSSSITREKDGLTVEELNAHLAWLRDKFVMWHTEMTPSRKASVLSSIFGVEN
jgi:hypothetical protein